MIVDYHMHLRDRRRTRSTRSHGRRVEPFVEPAHAARRRRDRVHGAHLLLPPDRAAVGVPYQVERCVHDLDAYVRCGHRGAGARAAGEARARGRLRRRAARTRRARSLRRIRGTTCSGRCTSSTGSASTATDAGMLDALGVEESWRLYFESWPRPLAAVCSTRLSHPDLVKIFGEPSGVVLTTSRPRVRSRTRGVAVEVSTAGLRKPVGELYPHPRVSRGVPRARRPGDARLGCAFAGPRRPRLRPGARAAALRGIRDRHGVRAARAARQEPLG